MFFPFHSKKSLGQNFLVNPRVVENILRAANLNRKELVIEVGPGFGILTEALLREAKKVIAIEKDTRLFSFLCEKFKTVKNLELIHDDALKFSPPKVPYYFIANLPYSITSPLLNHFIKDQCMMKNGHPPLCAVVMVQKEVAQKLCAVPPRMNILALNVQTFGSPKIISYISKNNFQPRPKVDSAIVKIEFPKKLKRYVNYEKYFSIIHRAFSQKRKMLKNTLGIEDTRRPERLSVKDWKKLACYSS